MEKKDFFFDEMMVSDKNGKLFNPLPGSRYLYQGRFFKLESIWWRSGKRSRVELLDEVTGKLQEGTWEGFERMITDGEMEWV